MRQQVMIVMQKLTFPWTLQGNQLARIKNEFILKLVKVSTFVDCCLIITVIKFNIRLEH